MKREKIKRHTVPRKAIEVKITYRSNLRMFALMHLNGNNSVYFRSERKRSNCKN